MANEISPLQSIQDKVKERIRSSFAELIPEEMWDGLIKQNIDAYMKVEFPAMVKDLAKVEIERRVREQFNKAEWQHQWDQLTGHNTASQMVERIVREAAPQLVEALFGGIVHSVVQAVRNNSLPRY